MLFLGLPFPCLQWFPTPGFMGHALSQGLGLSLGATDEPFLVEVECTSCQETEDLLL